MAMRLRGQRGCEATLIGSSVQSVPAVLLQYRGSPWEVEFVVAESSREFAGACCCKLYSYVPNKGKDEEKEEDRYL